MQNVTKMTFVNGVVVTVTVVNGGLQWWMVSYNGEWWVTMVNGELQWWMVSYNGEWW
jgi:hypothetical protein